MLAYKDFGGAKSVTTGGFVKVVSTVFESFDTALMQANAWIEEESIPVLSVETVQTGTNQQFLRVWYRTEERRAADREDR